jgi:hypothetical protein
MNIKLKLLVLTLLYTLCLFPISLASYTLVANGSFETGDLTDWITSETNQGVGSQIVKLNAYDSRLYPTDGNFFDMLSLWKGVPNQVYISGVSDLVILSGNTYDICFDWGRSTSALGTFKLALSDVSSVWAGSSFSPAVSWSSDITGDTNQSMVNKCFYGVVNSYGKNLRLVFATYNGFFGSGGYSNIGIDNIKIQKYGVLSNTISTTSQPVSVLQPFNIFVEVKDELGNNVSDANVKLRFNADANVLLSYNAGLGNPLKAQKVCFSAGGQNCNDWCSIKYYWNWCSP